MPALLQMQEMADTNSTVQQTCHSNNMQQLSQSQSQWLPYQ
jgi:hypothetical protein